MTRPSRRTRLCRHCLIRTIAGVAWPLWGGREGWPRLSRCRGCAAPARD